MPVKTLKRTHSHTLTHTHTHSHTLTLRHTSHSKETLTKYSTRTKTAFLYFCIIFVYLDEMKLTKKLLIKPWFHYFFRLFLWNCLDYIKQLITLNKTTISIDSITCRSFQKYFLDHIKEMITSIKIDSIILFFRLFFLDFESNIRTRWRGGQL